MRKLLLVFALFIGASPLAQAQWTAGLGMTNWVIWPQPDLTVPIPSTINAPQSEERQEPPLLAPATPAVQANARELAAHFPQEQRVKMGQLFVQSMDVYGQLTKKLDIPQRDMAGSLAAFIVGNYMVMNQTDVSDDVFKTVARQLRTQQPLREMGKRVKATQLRTLYEQSAMVGTFMALTWKSHQRSPQPAPVWTNVRDAARANLQAVLRADPTKLRLDQDGMRLER